MRRTAGVALVVAGVILSLLAALPIVAIVVSDEGLNAFRVTAFALGHGIAGVGSVIAGARLLRKASPHTFRWAIRAAIASVFVSVAFMIALGGAQFAVIYGTVGGLAAISGVLAALALRHVRGNVSAS